MRLFVDIVYYVIYGNVLWIPLLFDAQLFPKSRLDWYGVYQIMLVQLEAINYFQ